MAKKSVKHITIIIGLRVSKLRKSMDEEIKLEESRKVRKTKALESCSKDEFGKKVGCSVNFLNSLDEFTERVFSKKDSARDCMVGNYEQKFCGRSNKDQNIWVGCFFDTDVDELKNKLVVGFCIYDSLLEKNEYKKEQFIKLDTLESLMEQYPFFIERITYDGGYWIYLILEEVSKVISEETGKIVGKSLIKMIKKMIKKVTINMKSNKEKKECKESKRCGYWIFKILHFVLLAFLFVIGYLLISNDNDFINNEMRIIFCSAWSIYFILLIITIVLIIVSIFKDATFLKIEKLNELFSIKQKILNDSLEDSCDKKTEEDHTGKKIISKKSNRADLLKHYMTCVTEL